MNELLAVAAITILAVISPGPDFAMVTRNSYGSGRGAGLLTAAGIALGVQIHVCYTLFGIAVIIAQSQILFTLMKFAGATYLIYIGFKSFTNRTVLDPSGQGGAQLSGFAAFRTGFFTNALNPKTMLFVVSAYTQIVRPRTPLAVDLGYGFFMSFAHWAWFSLVAVFFSSALLRRILIDRQTIIDRGIGFALMLLGLALALTGVEANR